MSSAGAGSESLPSLHATTSEGRGSSSESYVTSRGGLYSAPLGPPITPIKTPPIGRTESASSFEHKLHSRGSFAPPASSGSLNFNDDQWPPIRPFSGQTNLYSRSALSSGGSSFVTRPLTGIRPMTGVSVPMSREDSENLNRPLTGTEDLKNSSAYLQAEKSSAQNKVNQEINKDPKRRFSSVYVPPIHLSKCMTKENIKIETK